MSDDNTADTSNVTFTHILFSNGDINYAFPISDVQLSTNIKTRTISVYNVVNDIEYKTDRVRVSTPLEVIRFLNGKYNPFNNYGST